MIKNASSANPCVAFSLKFVTNAYIGNTNSPIKIININILIALYISLLSYCDIAYRFTKKPKFLIL